MTDGERPAGTRYEPKNAESCMPTSWTALLLAAIAAGMTACVWLVARRRLAALSGLVSLLLVAAAASQVVTIARSTGHIGVGMAAGTIGIGAVLGGFLLAAALVPSFTRMPDRHRLEAGSESPQPAVVIVAHGQPEHYTPFVTTQSFDRLGGSGVPLPPLSLRVFAYASDRSRYRAAGINPTRPVVRAITTRATDLLEHDGFIGEVREAWLEGFPQLCDAIDAARESGAQAVAVVLLDVSQSHEYDLALRGVGGPGCETEGLTLAYSPPLWSEDALARLVCDKVLAALPGGPRHTDGVAIVATGQPPAWDQTHPQATEQRTYFCQRVRRLLMDSGLEGANIRTAWMDWQDPDVTEVVRHLSAVGCERIVIVPATAVADTLDIAVDLPAAVAQAAVDKDLRVEVLHGWGDDPGVAEVVARAAMDALEELGWPPTGDDQ